MHAFTDEAGISGLHFIYIEVAPPNRYAPKDYEAVAGCLIAFAFRKSVYEVPEPHNAIIRLDVKEENEEDKLKLIEVYRNKYHFLRIGSTTTLDLMDDNGYQVIKEYLQRGH